MTYGVFRCETFCPRQEFASVDGCLLDRKTGKRGWPKSVSRQVSCISPKGESKMERSLLTYIRPNLCQKVVDRVRNIICQSRISILNRGFSGMPYQTG